MTPLAPSMFLAAILAAASFPATAADSAASAASDSAKPAIGHRVGGSPADAEFRAVMQTTGDTYRKARTECRTKKGDERSTCLKGAKATMQAARAEAKTKHDAAVAEARAAAKK